MNAARLLLPGLLAALLAACAPEPPTPPQGPVPGPPAEAAGATAKDFGEYILYFNALRTSDLTPDVARTYDIVRSPNRVMLNVSINRKEPGTPGVAVPGKVTAQVVNLNAQLKGLTLREIREDAAIYYIGDVSVADDETLVFTIEAVPEGTQAPLAVRFSRQFVAN
jgi:hypothetical protein